MGIPRLKPGTNCLQALFVDSLGNAVSMRLAALRKCTESDDIELFVDDFAYFHGDDGGHGSVVERRKESG